MLRSDAVIRQFDCSVEVDRGDMNTEHIRVVMSEF
jgi:hypothetical protein